MSNRHLRVGVLINHGSVLGRSLLNHLDDKGGVNTLFISHSDTGREKWKRIGKLIKRDGIVRIVDQGLGSIYRKLIWGRNEARQLADLIDLEKVKASLPHHIRVYNVPCVNSAEMEAVLREADLDVLCVMCKEMLPKSLLRIPRRGVIGQHPGITPHYRGSWSAFWALANGEPHMIGTTVFVMDERADTGAVIYQERVEIEPGKDTFYSLTVKGQIKSAVLMARALDDLRHDRLKSFKRVSNRKKTYYPVPGLTDFVASRRRVNSALAKAARQTTSTSEEISRVATRL